MGGQWIVGAKSSYGVLRRKAASIIGPRGHLLTAAPALGHQQQSLRFKDDFYCIPPGILETVLKKRNLDAFRKVPTVSYVGLGPTFGDDTRFFDKIAASMRKWGRIFEDMAKVSMPAYEHTENGLPRFYPSVPQQHNGSVKNTSNNSLNITSLDNDIMDVVQESRKEIILDIVMGPHNSEIGKALEALDSSHVR
ncbi:uncharacterized protein DS421_17g584260 [Arachis hypogaea]|nr:uncharacterized protein DS421_17g584260 [Arachis hypogaea]